MPRAGAAPRRTGRPAPPATVVLVSFDGFRADYLDRPLPLEHFRRVATRGARARGLVPSWPSKTFPNHYTLVTGERPGHHGIVGNTFWDPALDARFALSDTLAVRDARWWGGDPLWVGAARAGVRTGAAFWPGTEALIAGTRPWRWLRYDGRMPNEARVDTVAAWLAVPEAERPRLVLLYFSMLDDAGHRHGPDAPQTDSALVAADRVLGRLLGVIARSPVADRAHVVVVSDHGMRAVTRAGWLDLSACDLPRDGVRTGDPGPVATVWVRGDAARREAVRAALDACVRAHGGHARVLRREETPAHWAVREQPRAGDLVVAAEPGWQVTLDPPPAAAKAQPLERVTGAHGWDAREDPQMHGLFLVAGPRVRPGAALGLVDNVDVAPFVARLLGIPAPRGADGAGRSLDGVLVR